MDSRRLAYVIGGAGLVLLGLSWLTVKIVIPAFIRRKRITRTTAVNGWILEKPEYLASHTDLGPIPLEQYSLARSIGSEYGDGNPLEKAAIGWAIRNVANNRGWSITKLSTYTTKFGDQGLYGTQEHGRNHATTRDPTDEDAWIAGQILSGQLSDPTGGARKFFDPSAQDALHMEKPDIYRTSAAIVDKWKAEGFTPIDVPGIDSRHLRLFV